MANEFHGRTMANMTVWQWTPFDVAAIIRAAVDHARRRPDQAECALRSLTVLAEELAPGAGPLKVCSACGASYDLQAWSALEHIGVQSDGTDRWELRDCRCGSTIGTCLGPCIQAPEAGESANSEATVRAVIEGLGGDPRDEPLVREALGLPRVCPKVDR